MAKLQYYMHDGANWQARAVLAYVQNCSSWFEDEIHQQSKKAGKNPFHLLEVGRYENCREQGYVVSVHLGVQQLNIAFYEHRNTDDICVLISKETTMNTPSMNDMWKPKGENATKYDYDKDFKFGQILECGKYIETYILTWIGEVYEKIGKEEQ